MLDRTVDLDLTHQLLLCSALHECLLAHHLSSQYGCSLRGLECLNFIALGKSSLTKELAFKVAPDLHLSIVLGDLLFDDGVYWGLVVLAGGG